MAFTSIEARQDILRGQYDHTAVGTSESTMTMSTLFDDMLLWSMKMQTIGYMNDADIVVSDKKSESMHVGLHPRTRMSATKEAEIYGQPFSHLILIY